MKSAIKRFATAFIAAVILVYLSPLIVAVAICIGIKTARDEDLADD